MARRLSRYVLLLSAGLLLMVTLLVGIFSRAIITRGATEYAEKNLELAIKDIEQVIGEVERAVNNVDWFVQRHSRNARFMYDATRELVSTNPNIIGSAVAFEPGYFRGERWFAPYTYIDAETGEMHSFQMGNPSYDYPTYDWYRVPWLHDKAMWSEPYFDEGGGGQPMATYSLPLKDTTGHFFGILTSDISLDWLTQRINQVSPYNLSYATLVSASGIFIAHPDSTRIMNMSIFDVAAQSGDEDMLAIAEEMVSGKKGFRTFKNGDNFAAYGPLTNGWSLLVVNNYDEVFVNIVLFNVWMVFFLLIGLAGLYFGCRKVVRRQTMPLVEFSHAAMTMGKGNFQAMLPEVKTKDELASLRNSLEYMQWSINDYISELKTTTASNERYESELTIARGIQMALLPHDFPQMAECSLHAMVQPAKEVGGDLYDFVDVGDSLYFMVGDVSGKGVPAALFMAITRAAFRFVGSMGLSMAEVMRRVNNSLCDGNDRMMFVTLFAGRLDRKTGTLTFCNAGHNPILVIPPEGRARFVHAKPNLAAGLQMDFPYEEETLQLEKGTRLVLYTDGVTEAERPDKEQFGERRMQAWANRLNPDVSAKALTSSLYSQVKEFTRGAEQNDDITILTVLYHADN